MGLKRWFVLLSTLFIFQEVLSMERILNWTFVNPRSGEVVTLGEKGSVQEGLIAAGILPDPFYGMNEKEFAWIEEYQWEFRSTFVLDAEFLQLPFVDLDFPSLDTYAEVYVNDELVLASENAFKPYSVNAKPFLRVGDNSIRIVFTPPVMYHKERFEKADYRLPAPNDQHPIAIAPYTRKPQYQFGWDWALRMNTIGLNKPAKLVAYRENEPIGKNIQVLHKNGNNVTLKMEWYFRQHVNGIVTWKSELFGDVNFTVDKNVLSAEVTLENPQWWWPRGHGDHHLYTDEWSLVAVSGKKIAGQNLRFGVRTTELIQEKDQWGTSYYMRINGKAIFCKGGDYIPQDIFPARVTDTQLREMVQQMHAANFNMVRVWGGGYYPDEAFYEACDEMGIMVWQDFMFACSMYPGDEQFLENVGGEIDFQIPRIASHPSVVLFNGNNEVDVAWKNWGFQIKYGLYGKSAKAIEKAYDAVFKELIPDRVEQYTNIPYVHTSPLSNWGKDEYFNHGTQHYWGVWHGKDPIEDFGKKIGRFNAEYGFQSFPEYSTLYTFADPSEWDLNSDVMKHHQKSYVGNGMIEKHSNKLFGTATDVEEFIYYSQLTQAKAVGMAISGHRIDWPRCGGTLYWQVNDCWPAPTWSSIDYFGNWKALHYQVKTDFQDVAVLSKESEPYNHSFYIVSDVSDTFRCELTFTIYTVLGEWKESHTVYHQLEGTTVEPIPLNQLVQQMPDEYIIVARWNDQVGRSHERSFVRKTASQKADPSTVSWQVEYDPSQQTQFLVLTTETALVDCWITGKQSALRVEENFATLLPGTHRIPLKASKKLTKEDILLKYR